jgi:hypothetical protein
MPDDTPIADALSKTIVIPDVEDESLNLAVEKTTDDLGATFSASKDFGQPGGWSGGASASYWKSAGAVVKGWLSWKGKP